MEKPFTDAGYVLSKLTAASVEVLVDMNPLSAVTCLCGHMMRNHAEGKNEEDEPTGERLKCDSKKCVCMKFEKAESTEKSIRAWLAPLGSIEQIHAQAVAREAYNLVLDGGASEDDAAEASIQCQFYCTLYYTLRRGPEKNARRLFESLREVQMVPSPEVMRLIHIHGEKFVPTETEMGNSLRERTGALQILSSFPATSLEQHPSADHSPNTPQHN